MTVQPIERTDSDLLVDLDWQHETLCEAGRCTFGRPPARWRQVLLCGCVALHCAPCHEVLLRWLAEYGEALTCPPPDAATCLHCGHEFMAGLRLRDIFTECTRIAS